MESTFDKLKELNLSRDEVDRIGDALKKPEFRKLLSEYVQELQDPENKKIYEQEIIELEKERGIEVTFIHPKPGYVIKTSVNGTQKSFINICTNEIVGKPSSSPAVKEGAKGLTWSLPHTLSPPREDIDNKQARCQVFDVVFHPDTLHLAERNKSFRTMVNNTALDAVESNFEVKLDKKNLKFPKLTYKGNPNPSVIRKPTDTKPEHTPEEKQLFDKLFAKAEATVIKQSPKKQKTTRRGSVDDKSDYTTPKYVIKHRTHVDIQEFTENRDSKMLAAIPKELIIEVNLPLLKSSSEMQLDVNEKTVQLISEKPAKYKLNVTLPYRVSEVAGNAKFDKDMKKLIITLPVKRTPSSFSEFSDSGVESDHGSPSSPSSEEEAVTSDEKVIVLSEPEPSEEKCIEKSTEFRTSFLDDKVHYSLPEFTCHMFENTVAFTLNVKNVDERSVSKQFASNNQVHLKFISISSSFYPSHYAFYVRFPDHMISEADVTVEVWDNNVILQVPVINYCDNNSSNVPLTSYLYGIHGDQVEIKYIEEPAIIHRVFEENLVEEHDIVMPLEQPVKAAENTHAPVDCEAEKQNLQPTMAQDIYKPTKAIDIVGTSYESSGDEMSFNSYSPRKCKGILKQRMKRYGVGRSISESSLDDFIISSSYENCHMGGIGAEIPEEEDDDLEASNSLKKTVRFSDVIMKQMFRSNSSILGQKKKNQRKAKNKKRALERRHSESEASEVEEKKERELEDFGRKQHDELNTKKEDHDIFHLDDIDH